MLNYIFLAASTEGNSTYQFILIGGILLVFYFFMIRPQQKRQKEQQAFLAGLKKGEQVVTLGGIHGKVYDAAAETVVLEVDNKGTKITVSRAAISVDSTKRHAQKK